MVGGRWEGEDDFGEKVELRCCNRIAVDIDLTLDI